MPDKRKEGGSSSSTPVSTERTGGGSSSAKKARTSLNFSGSDSGQIGASESLTYDPVHFIRSHSKNNDPADIQTQVILSWLLVCRFIRYKNRLTIVYRVPMGTCAFLF